MSGLPSNVDTEAKLQALRAAITEKSPFCLGVLALEDDALRLIYRGRDGKQTSGYINFANATADDVHCLVEACNSGDSVVEGTPATNGKLGKKDFKTAIALERAGLMDAVRFDLLEGSRSAEPVYAELDSLNVYGLETSYKSNKDDIQSDGVFGTLVIVLPAPHEGGSIVLRYNGKEIVFDAGAVLKYAKEPSIAYIAFLNDVEHEIQPVTEGHRVALTYHLHFGTAPSQLRDPQPAGVTSRFLPPTEDTFLTVLRRLLADPTFLPEGGVLGFGLSHEYPVRRTNGNEDDVLFYDSRKPARFKFKELESRLKGRDALILDACRSLSLPSSLQAVYLDHYEEHEILCKSVLDMDAYNEYWNTDLWEIMKERTGGSVISVYCEENAGDVDFTVYWVTERTVFNEFKHEFAQYGNSADLQHLYGKLCLIVEVGPWGKRA